MISTSRASGRICAGMSEGFEVFPSEVHTLLYRKIGVKLCFAAAYFFVQLPD